MPTYFSTPEIVGGGQVPVVPGSGGSGGAAIALAKLSAAIAQVKAQTGSAILATVGDSVTAGWGSNITTGPGTGSASDAGNTARSKSWPQTMRAAFAGIGIPTRSDAMFGFKMQNATAANINAYNPDLALSANWIPSTVNGPAGVYLSHASATLDTFTFTPEAPADKFVFYTSVASSLGSFTVSDASGTLATVSETGASGFQKVTVSRATASTLPITITPTSSSAMYICGIRPYSSTQPMLEIWNMGWGGSTASAWLDASAAYAPFPGLLGFTPDVHAWTLELGANDAHAAVSAATYQANMTSLIGRLTSNGADLVLVKPHKANPTSDSYNVPAGYLTAIDTLAASYSKIAAVDFNSLALLTSDYFDDIHLSGPGYAKEAPVAFSALRAGLQL